MSDTAEPVLERLSRWVQDRPELELAISDTTGSQGEAVRVISIVGAPVALTFTVGHSAWLSVSVGDVPVEEYDSAQQVGDFIERTLEALLDKVLAGELRSWSEKDQKGRVRRAEISFLDAPPPGLRERYSFAAVPWAR